MPADYRTCPTCWQRCTLTRCDCPPSCTARPDAFVTAATVDHAFVTAATVDQALADQED